MIYCCYLEWINAVPFRTCCKIERTNERTKKKNEDKYYFEFGRIKNNQISKIFRVFIIDRSIFRQEREARSWVGVNNIILMEVEAKNQSTAATQTRWIEHLDMVILKSFLIVLTIVLNSLVVFVFTCLIRKRTYTNYLFLSISISDLGIGLFAMTSQVNSFYFLLNIKCVLTFTQQHDFTSG